MPARANPEDEAALAAHAGRLADAVESALPAWVERCVARFVEVDEVLRPQVEAAARRATGETGRAVRALLEADVDEQRTSPLHLLRQAVRYPTEVLRAAGVAPVARGEFEARAFPDDVYDLSPASFADVDPVLHEPGLVWGAAKAYVFKQRRRVEGRS